MAHSGRIAALDGLRAVAILLVVGSHFVTERIPGGFGVTLFFFISGFIITRVLLQDSRLWPFYVRRFFRLAPALFVLVAVVFSFQPLVREDVRAVLLYYANYHRFRTPGLDITWSLAVEEHFYLLFPALVCILPRRRLLHALLLFVVAALAWRLVLVLGFDEIERIHRSTDTRLDSIAYGCLLSVLAARPDCRRIVDGLATRGALSAGFALLLACFVIRNDAFRETLRYSLQGIAFMPIFAALFLRSQAAPSWLRRPLESPAMTFIGRISYSLYLYHEIGFALEIPLVPEGLVAGVVATLLSYYVVETPTRRLGARLADRPPAWRRSPG